MSSQMFISMYYCYNAEYNRFFARVAEEKDVKDVEELDVKVQD